MGRIDLPNHVVLPLEEGREDPVIRADEEMAFSAADQQEPPFTANAGVDDGYEDRAGGKIGLRFLEDERGGGNVEGGHPMAEVDDRTLRGDLPDHPLHDPRVVIPLPKIGNQDNRLHGLYSIPKLGTSSTFLETNPPPTNSPPSRKAANCPGATSLAGL